MGLENGLIRAGAGVDLVERSRLVVCGTLDVKCYLIGHSEVHRNTRLYYSGKTVAHFGISGDNIVLGHV